MSLSFVFCFFDYLHENNPLCTKKDITEIPLSVLGNLAPMDIEEYLSYLKYYEKDGVEHTNDERGLKRKLASLRSFYRYLRLYDQVHPQPDKYRLFRGKVMCHRYCAIYAG